jgi:hypothetical protein
VKFAELNKKFVNIKNCTKEQKLSFANLVSFPNPINEELYKDVFSDSENKISELLITDTGVIIGGYIVCIITGYQIFYLKKIKVNPKLKSTKYTQEILDRVLQLGLSVYDENFKGIVGVSYFDENKKRKIENDFIDIKGYTIIHGSIIRNKSARLSYLPVNGGYNSDEIKEIFNFIKNI